MITGCYKRPNMELRHLRYFLAVADELHFSRAAERLHIVQPALSKQIAALEREMGVQLFERTKRTVTLTDSGLVFQGLVRDILARVDDAVAAAQRAARGMVGQLSVGFVGPVVDSVLPGILLAYRDRCPEVHLDLHELTSANQIGQLHDRSLDLGFVRMPVSDAGIEFAPVYREPVLVALPADHRLAGEPKIRLEMLAGEPLVTIPRAREPGLFDHYVDMCRTAGFSPNVAQEVLRIHTILGLVAAGMGYTFTPASSLSLGRSGVVYKTIIGSFPPLVIALARRREPPSPVLRSFVETVRDVARAGLDAGGRMTRDSGEWVVPERLEPEPGQAGEAAVTPPSTGITAPVM